MMEIFFMSYFLLLAPSTVYCFKWNSLWKAPRLTTSLFSTFRSDFKPKEYLICSSNNTTPLSIEFKDLLQGLKVNKPDLTLLYSNDERFRSSKSNEEPKLLYYCADPKQHFILDSYLLERPYLGKNPYNMQDTITKWIRLIEERQNIVRLGSKFADSFLVKSGEEPLRSELNLIISLLQRISYVIKSYQDRLLSNLHHQLKSDSTVVTIADYAIQAILIAKIHQYYPEDLFYAEETLADLLNLNDQSIDDILAFIEIVLQELWTKEKLVQTFQILSTNNPTTNRSDNSHPRRKRGCWIIDPIDGTRGFIQGKHFSIAVSLVDHEESQKSDDITPLLSIIACPTLPDLSLRQRLTAIETPKPIEVICPADVDQSTLPAFPDLNTGSIFFTYQNEGVVYTRSLSMPLGSAFALTNDEEQSVKKSHVITTPYEGKTHDHILCNTLLQKIEEALGKKITVLPMHGQGKYCLVAAGIADSFLKISTQDNYQEKIYDHIAGQHMIRELQGKISNLYDEPLKYDIIRGIVLGTIPINVEGGRKNGIFLRRNEHSLPSIHPLISSITGKSS